MKAWSITVDGFDDAVVAAETRAKATYCVWSSAQEAGFHSVTFASIKTLRCKRLDGWAGKQTKRKCVIMSYAELENVR